MAYKILDKALQGNATTLRSAPCFSKPTPPTKHLPAPRSVPSGMQQLPSLFPGEGGSQAEVPAGVSASPFLLGQEANAGASCHSLSPPSGSGR